MKLVPHILCVDFRSRFSAAINRAYSLPGKSLGELSYKTQFPYVLLFENDLIAAKRSEIQPLGLLYFSTPAILHVRLRLHWIAVTDVTKSFQICIQSLKMKDKKVVSMEQLSQLLASVCISMSIRNLKR